MDRNNSMTKNNQKQNMKSNTQRQHPIAARREQWHRTADALFNFSMRNFSRDHSGEW